MFVSATQLAKEFGVSTARISQLRVQGLPGQTNGKFDLLKCFRWYVNFLQNALAHRSVPEGGSGHRGIMEARRRKLQADAEVRELELAKLRRELIAAPDVERRWIEIASTIRARLLAVGSRIAPRIVGEADRSRIERQIDGEIRQALTELATENRTRASTFPS